MPFNSQPSSLGCVFALQILEPPPREYFRNWPLLCDSNWPKSESSFLKTSMHRNIIKKKFMRGSESSVKMYKFKLHKRLYKPDYHPLTCVTLVFIRLCSDMCTCECLALLLLLL